MAEKFKMAAIHEQSILKQIKKNFNFEKTI
jgi:hypothetical protein